MNTILLAIRRNHALEHAVVHLLSKKAPKRPLAGLSTPGGFFLLGDIETEEIQTTADEALARLRDGQSHLAIHPGCGTNLVLKMLAAGLGAWLGMKGSRNDRQRLERLPLAGLLALGAIALVQPVGPWAQKHLTTEADPGNLQIVAIHILRAAPPRIHFVETHTP